MNTDQKENCGTAAPRLCFVVAQPPPAVFNLQVEEIDEMISAFGGTRLD
jgi:hypothetical protein